MTKKSARKHLARDIKFTGCMAGMIGCILFLWKLILPALFIIINIVIKIGATDGIGWHLLSGLTMLAIWIWITYLMIRLVIISSRIGITLIRERDY